MAKYYDVHVFISRSDGYSIPVKIEIEKELTDDEVIEFASDNDLFTEDGDQHHVDYVSEMGEEEYKNMKLW